MKRPGDDHGWLLHGLLSVNVRPDPHPPPARTRRVRRALPWLILAGVLSPGTVRAAAGSPPMIGQPEWLIPLALVLAAAAGAWFAARRWVRRAEQDARQLRSVLEFADCLLWYGTVDLGTWKWEFTVQDTGFSRRLFGGHEPGQKPQLWDRASVPDLEEMDGRCREALRTGQTGYEQQFRFIQNGRTYWLRESVSITPIETERYSLVGIITDVTAQHEAEAARRATQEQLQQLLARADCLLWQARVTQDNAGQFHWDWFIPESELLRRLLGAQGALNRRPWDSAIVPEFAQIEARPRKAMLEGESGYQQEFRVMPDRGVTWLREQVSVRRLGPREWMLEGVAIDITAQRKAEEITKVSEAQLKKVVDTADFMLWHARVIRRPNGRLHWVLNVPGSSLYRRLYGRDPDEPAVLAWEQLVGPEMHREMSARGERAILEGRESYEQEFRAETKERVYWLNERATIQRANADEWMLVGVVTDVTSRHEAEAARQASEQALHNVIARADCLVWRAQVELRDGAPSEWDFTIQPSGLCELIFGASVPQKSVGLWREFDIPELEEMHERSHEAMRAGKSGYEQVFHILRGERPIWLRESVSIKPTGPRQFSLVGVVVNITAQHEAEVAREASEEALHDILERANCLLWRARVVLRDGNIEWSQFDLPASRLCRELLGKKAGAKEVQLWDAVHVPELEEMNLRSRHAIFSGADGYEQEFSAVTDQRRFWLHEQVAIIPVAENEWRLVGVITDVTDRHEAREAQHRSEARIEELLRRADCMIWEGKVGLEPDGRLQWQIYAPRSKLHRRLFGEDTERMFFHWAGLGVPEHEEMQERARAALIGGKDGYEQQFHVPRPDGDIWVTEQVSITPSGPNRWDVIGIITDVTDRRRAEEARRTIEARLQELLERADCMVWEATATEQPDGEFAWNLFAPHSALYRRLFGVETDNSAVPTLNWHKLNVPEVEEMAERADQAIRQHAKGYEQEFRVVLAPPDGVLWLREVVTITPLDTGRVKLVGVIIDITAQREAQEAHKASEAQVEQMLATVDCLLWQARVFEMSPGQLRWVLFIPKSRLYRDIFGADPEPQPYLHWDRVLDPATDEEIGRRAVAHLLSGASGYEQEFRVQRGAREFWLHEQVAISPVGPNEWKLVGVITDLAARREAERAVHESELRFRTLFEHTPVAIVETDFGEVGRLQAALRAQGVSDLGAYFDQDPRRLHEAARSVRFVDCNATAVAMFRAKTKSDFRRRRGLLATAEAMWMVKTIMLAVWEGRNAVETEAQMKDFAGAAHQVHVRWWVERGKDGLDLRQAVIVLVDVTELKKAEAALAAEKERLAVTLRAMAEGVVTTDVEGRVQYLNPAAAEFIGLPTENVIGRRVAEICHFENDRSGETVEVPVERVALGDVVLDLPPSTRLVSAEAGNRLVEGCCAPLHAADSVVIGTVLVFRDVTEHERLEQELVRASKLESVGILAGGIAHDFNNILTAVMGNVALALIDLDPATEAAQSLREAEKATLRARDLTHQLLTFAKGGEPVRTAVHLEGIVREMTTFTLHGSRVRAVYEVPPDLWPAEADKAQIGRVVQNLVINAVQAMPEGGTIRIVMSNEHVDGLVRPALAPGNYVQIAITDTGVGIKSEHLSRIFDPYFTTKQMGSGLGLAAVYSIVNKHRGAIDVQSQLGVGTTFRIWLPASPIAPASSEANGAPAKSAPMKGRVLFMDDEEAIRQMARFLLKRFGFEVVCVSDGAETVRAYAEARAAGQPFTLVIMDLTVPGGMGGREAIAQLRAMDPNVKAIVSSGYSSDPVLANYRAHGFCGVVAKPYEIDDLARVLREALAGDQGGGSAPARSS